MEKLWTAAQTADYLHVSKYTIYKWLAQGKLQRSKAGGRTLIREAEIMNLIEDEPRHGSSVAQPMPRRPKRATRRHSEIHPGASYGKR